MRHVIELEKWVPVAHDVNVAVAGAGVSGLFAALGAAKCGASVVLVDRFGQLGGNMGPGLFIGSRLYDEPGRTLHEIEYPGIPREFVDRLEKMLAESGVSRNYPHYCQTISRLALEMLREARVALVLSAHAADPILEKNRVRGLFVETKSGVIAIRAQVVIDATGDAEVAARAGAPVRRGARPEECDCPLIWPGYLRPECAHWNDGGLYFVIAGADYDRFQAFCAQKVEMSAEDRQFMEEAAGYMSSQWPAPMVPILRRAQESGEFRVWRRFPGPFFVTLSNWFEQVDDGLVGGRAQMFGDYDISDWQQVSFLEAEMRALVFDAVAFLRRQVPGFEGAWLLTESAFLGSRGGPCIEGEYTLTPHELWKGASFPDALFRSYVGAFRGRGSAAGCDMPYRMLLPKRVDGLLVVGRGMSYLRRGHDPAVRARCNLMMLGQAAGMAAALAAAEGVEPRALDIDKLQRVLRAEGFPLHAAGLETVGPAHGE